MLPVKTSSQAETAAREEHAYNEIHGSFNLQAISRTAKAGALSTDMKFGLRPQRKKEPHGNTARERNTLSGRQGTQDAPVKKTSEETACAGNRTRTP